MTERDKETRAPVLDPVNRVSEIIFGLLMALSFTGSVNAATAGREEVRTMMLAALGCNLAWGIVDAVMYLVGTLTERSRNLMLWHRVRRATDPHAAHAILAEALPGRLNEAIGPDGLEEMRRRLIALSEPPARARLGRDDYSGAVGVFLLVVLATFPVVIPFMLISENWLAMRASNAVALAMLFVAGRELGKYAGRAAWRAGLGMTGLGAVLVVVIMALGG